MKRFQFNGDPEQEWQVYADKLMAEGNYVRDRQRYPDAGAVDWHRNLALMAYQQRPGRDRDVIALSDAGCVRCERRNADDYAERLCLPCKVFWNAECKTSFHDMVRSLPWLRPDRGVNCPQCNLWLPPDAGTNYDLLGVEHINGRRILDHDVEIGLLPMAAFKCLVSNVLPKDATVTASLLRARIGDSMSAIPAGGSDELYTAILTFERFLNVVEHSGVAVGLGGRHAGFVDSAWTAIECVAEGLRDNA